MCGRYSQNRSLKELASRFSALPLGPSFAPSPLFVPSQKAVVVTRTASRNLDLMRWGLAPSWSKEDPGAKLFNARAETLLEKPSFRDAFRARRCLVPADAFFEKRAGAPPRSLASVTAKGGGLFAFAGLWDAWRGPDGAELRSFTVITTSANELLRPIHDRMPVILREEDEGRWLDPAGDLTALQKLLVPCAAGRLELFETGQLSLLG